MHFIRTLLIAVFMSISLLFAPLPMSAAGLVPCGTTEHPEACTLCHILIGGKAIIDWGMGIMVIVGLALIMIAGVMYIVSVGDSSMMTKAKDGMKTVLIGVTLILCGWLIVNTIIGLLASDSMGVGIRKENWYSFTCDPTSTANTSGATGTNVTSTPGPSAGGADCADANATSMKARVTSGGAMCGSGYTCPRCDTVFWNAFIEKYRVPAGVPRPLVDAMIAKESSCRENPGAMDGKSCGLTQVKFASVGNTDCAGPAMNLNDPEINIREGMKVLKAAWDASAGYDYTGIGIKREEIAYVIYNSGTKDVAQSSDCKATDGWPAKFPRYACPIKPGETQFNACYIREQSCKVGACF